MVSMLNVQKDEVEQTIRQWMPIVYYWANRWIRSPALQGLVTYDELVSSGRLAVWEALQRYDKSVLFGTFVSRVVRHRMGRHRYYWTRKIRMNHQHSHRIDHDPYWELHPKHPLEPERPPEDRIDGERIGEQVREALARLPERWATAVRMQSEGHSDQEIGRVLGVCRSRAKQLVAKGKERLRSDLACLAVETLDGAA